MFWSTTGRMGVNGWRILAEADMFTEAGDKEGKCMSKMLMSAHRLYLRFRKSNFVTSTREATVVQGGHDWKTGPARVISGGLAQIERSMQAPAPRSLMPAPVMEVLVELDVIDTVFVEKEVAEDSDLQPGLLKVVSGDSMPKPFDPDSCTEEHHDACILNRSDDIETAFADEPKQENQF